MKNRKIFGLAVCALALASVVSCGPDEGGKGTVTYNDVSTPITIWASDAEIDVINKVVDKYNAEQTEDSQKFKITTKAVSEADAGTTLSNDPTVSGAPALFLCADDHINNLVSKDIVLEIQGTYKERIVESTAEVSVQAVTLDDKLYGFPVTSDNGYFLWYDSSVISDEDAQSLERIIEVCKEKGKTFGFDIENGYYSASFFLSPEACGADSVRWKRDANNAIVYDINWDNAEGVKVAEYANSLLQPNATLIKGDTKGANALFAAGFMDRSMVACISGTWMEGDLTKAIGKDLKATKLPSYHIGEKAYQLGSFSGTKTYCINKTRPAAEQRVAAALGDLLSTKESQLVRYETRQSVPCNKEAVEDPRYTDHLTLSAVAIQEQSQYSATQSQAAENRYWDVGQVLGGAMLRGLPEELPTWKEYLESQCNKLRTAV